MEQVICGGSSRRAPGKQDFMQRVGMASPGTLPEIVIVRQEDREAHSDTPLCFLSEADVHDPMRCIGIVTQPGEALLACLRAGPVRARVRSLCLPDGTPCRAEEPDCSGFLAEFEPGTGLSPALQAALSTALLTGRGKEDELKRKLSYLREQAVPEPVILAVLESIPTGLPYAGLIPDPPVPFLQESAAGELTRALSYRLKGMNLRLVGNKGSGKNTLMQTVDWLLGIPQYRMQGSAELDKLDLLGGPSIEDGTMSYRLSDMLVYLQAGADVVLDEGNTIKPECADVLHSLTDSARCIQVPGYGLVRMHPLSAFTITMNEDYAGTNFMNEATVDRFTPLHMSLPRSIAGLLRRVVPDAPEESLRICDALYQVITDQIRERDGLEPEALSIRGFIHALQVEELIGLRAGLLDNIAGKPQDLYTRLQLSELIESMVP